MRAGPAAFLTAFHRPEPSWTVPGGGPGCAVAPLSSSGCCQKEEKSRSVQLKLWLQSPRHQPASELKTHRQRPLPPEQSEGHTEATTLGLGSAGRQACSHVPSGLDRRGSRVQVPLVLSF